MGANAVLKRVCLMQLKPRKSQRLCYNDYDKLQGGIDRPTEHLGKMGVLQNDPGSFSNYLNTIILCGRHPRELLNAVRAPEEWNECELSLLELSRRARVENGNSSVSYAAGCSWSTAALNSQGCHLHRLRLSSGSQPSSYQDPRPGLGEF